MRGHNAIRSHNDRGVDSVPRPGRRSRQRLWPVCLRTIGAALVSGGNQYWKTVGQIMMLAAFNGVGSGAANAGLLGEAGLTAYVGSYGTSFASGFIVATYASGGDVGAGLQAGAFAAAFTFAGSEAFGAKGLTPQRLVAYSMWRPGVSGRPARGCGRPRLARPRYVCAERARRA